MHNSDWPCINRGLSPTITLKPRPAGALGGNWEGPYRMAKVVKLGTYRLESTRGIEEYNVWNPHNFKVYYQ